MILKLVKFNILEIMIASSFDNKLAHRSFSVITFHNIQIFSRRPIDDSHVACDNYLNSYILQ